MHRLSCVASMLFVLVVIYSLPTRAQDSAPSSHFVFDDNFDGDIIISEVRVPNNEEGRGMDEAALCDVQCAGDIIRRYRNNPIIDLRALPFVCADICNAGDQIFLWPMKSYSGNQVFP